jgi:hypothetical protein
MVANGVRSNVTLLDQEKAFKWDKAKKQQSGRQKVWKRRVSEINTIIFVSCKVKWTPL